MTKQVSASRNVDRAHSGERYLTDQQVADRWSVSASSVRRRRYEGSLPTVRLGGVARIPLSAVLAYETAMTS